VKREPDNLRSYKLYYSIILKRICNKRPEFKQ